MKDESKVLLSVLSIFAALSVYRTIHFAQTGFFITDEFGYVYNAIYGDIYGNRWFFGSMNALLFKLFDIHSVGSFLFIMPFYLFFWPALTIVIWFKMMKGLNFEAKTITISLISSLFLVSFVILSLGFLTEPVGLALAMSGCFFLIRHLRKPSWLMCTFSALSFAAAAYTREPYVIFLIGGSLVVLMGAKKSRSLIAFSLPSAIFLFFPVNELGNIFSNTIGNAGPSASAPMIAPLTIRLLDTLKIFGFGMLLGWGPVLLVLAIIGAVIMLASKNLSKPNVSILTLSSLSILSFVVVAFIFSIDPTFLSPKSYSTIIRFSDTALPAYFLLAPFAISALVKRKTFSYGLPTALVLFLVVSVPLYGNYAAQRLPINPSTPTLAYRTVAAEVRDYILSHTTQSPYIMINPPFGWSFTPGVSRLNARVYFSNPTPTTLLEFPSTRVGLYYERLSIPYLSYDGFIKLKPTSFYIYSNTTDTSSKLPSYLLSIVASGQVLSESPFGLLSAERVMNGPNIIFVHVRLSW